nr:hypothetical protein [Desulfobacula sp.]
LIASSIIFLKLLFSPANGVLLLIACKSLIDASWKISFANMNLLKLTAVLVPCLLLPLILSGRKIKFSNLPLSNIGVLYLFSTLMGSFLLLMNSDLMSSLNYSFRILNGFLSFYMFQYFFNDKENLKKLIIALLIAGLLPTIIGGYQIYTGRIWDLRKTVDLVRHNGLYHDIVTVRMYCFQTIIAILLFWTYFSDKRFFHKVCFAAYFLLCSAVIYKCYSKAAIAVYIMWAIVWAFLSKKLHWLLIIVLTIVAFNFATGNKIYNEVERVFTKELQYQEGNIDQRRMLSGRGYVWERILQSWGKLNIVYKIMGSGKLVPAHNDYLRSLVTNGIIGVTIYIIVLLLIGFLVIKNALKKMTPLNIVAVMVYLMYMLDTIGVSPSMYSGYQWFVWGFVGLALKGVDGIDETSPND